MTHPARLPVPPYFAVVFASRRSSEDDAGYAAMADRMAELAAEQPGYLGIDTVRGSDGFGITVSYWRTEDDIRNWHHNAEHRVAQAHGRARWYASFQLHVCKVERAYGFPAP
jgi:heme-degrading monooxygenase HmoA